MDDSVDMTLPTVASKDKTIAQLRQVTIKRDEDISQVNDLLTDGWRVVSIGYHADATVYVLGKIDEKPKHRPGFLSASAQ